MRVSISFPAPYRTKKIEHPNGVPDFSFQINDIGDDLVPQSFANALMV